ncbi:A/G-specific adenine glycosylase [Yunchengibacter salinarum]|uniref:A/G-specific adenine glycosylase n=1 Tax=Yunchengibacter salinarum TaxID=3133399 RepID=UPI0035B680B7
MDQPGKQLLTWYDRNGRTLPWRAPPGARPDPYHVWLSEIMLQQTTVQTVGRYFTRFLSLWPDVTDLAAADRDSVLAEWAGLGYYARARNLHACARAVMADHGGRFPDTEDGLRALPGIGDYTAAAIAAIAFGRPAAVVDGNIERVIARLHRVETPLPAAKPEIRDHVAAITPADRPGDFAQAMMDLGAMVCTPRRPNCLLCPWQGRCLSAGTPDVERFPVKTPKKTKPLRRGVVFWPVRGGHVLLQRRPDAGLLGGMPGLYGTPWTERDDFPAATEWAPHAPVAAQWTALREKARHSFTHFHLETRILMGEAGDTAPPADSFWHPLSDLKKAGLPTVFKKMARLATD